MGYKTCPLDEGIANMPSTVTHLKKVRLFVCMCTRYEIVRPNRTHSSRKLDILLYGNALYSEFVYYGFVSTSKWPNQGWNCGDFFLIFNWQLSFFCCVTCRHCVFDIFLVRRNNGRTHTQLFIMNFTTHKFSLYKLFHTYNSIQIMRKLKRVMMLQRAWVKNLAPWMFPVLRL